ncbi:MAG: DUF5667 domain-containing protein [bacterium]|nr:DUF5667 domain-containing protein [bacterium]
MNTLENILDEAIVRLRKGEDVLSIAQSYPDYKDEVLDLLSVAQITAQIPKLRAPIPHKQYRFTEIRTLPYRFAEIFQFMRIAVIPLSLIMALFGGKLMVQATENSLPGDRLYSLKRAGEEARLNLTFSPDKTATIHVELAQRRLNEVKKAIDNKDIEQGNAAIAELQAQTEKTFATVPQVAAVNAVSKNDSTLLHTLVAINKEQKSLLNIIEDSNQENTVAKTALDSTKENDKKIAQLIATVNEQTLVDLPNKISITGLLSFSKDNKITVEKNTFVINDETTINNIDGTLIETIPEGEVRVTVIGSKSDSGLVAKQIQIIAVEPKVAELPTPAVGASPTVKGAATIKPVEPKLIHPPVVVDPAPTVGATPSSTPSDEASGTYIVEPTEDQYTP